MEGTTPSSYNDYLNNRYKFVSFDLYVSLNKQTTFRETYQVLDWLGDVGGLFGLCKNLVGMMVTWIA